MPRLPRITAAQLMPALKRDGWYQVSQHGSHLQLRHPTKPGKVSVALHAGKVIPAFILTSILKQAGLTADELRGLLK